MADGQTVRIQVYPGAIINLMPWVMVERGFCEAHKLKCELVQLPSAPLGVQGVVSGSLEVALMSTDVSLQAASRGTPVQIIAGLQPTQPFALSFRKDVPAPNRAAGYPTAMRDVKGLKVGVTARGAGPEIQMRSLLSAAGMNPDSDVVFVAVGSPAAAYSALMAKQIDAAMSFEPFPSICDSGETCFNLVDLRKGEGSPDIRNLNGAAITYVAAKSFIEKSPAAVDAFRQAEAEAIEWSAKPENFDAVMTVVAKYFKLGDIPHAEQVTRTLVKNQVSGYRWTIDRKGVKGYSDFMLKSKQIEQPVTPEAFVYGKAY